MMMQPESGAKQRPSSFFNEKREGVRSLETPVLKRLVHKIQRLLAYILWLAIAVIILGVCLGLQARRKDASGDAENDAEENSGRASTNDGRGRS
jgi:GMP synthase-like glutamine amidotransferase